MSFMKKALGMLFVIILSLVLFSCSKTEASITEVISVSDGSNLGVWLDAVVPSEENLVMTLKNPSGNLSWTVNAKSEEFEGKKYFGYTGFSMPDAVEFESGNWTVELGCPDGQVVTESFQLH